MSNNIPNTSNRNRFDPMNGYKFLYIRNRKNQVAGVIAVLNGKVGWSLCHSVDAFSKETARQIACDPNRMIPVPNMDAVIKLINVYNTQMNQALCFLATSEEIVPHTIKIKSRKILQTRMW